MSNLAEYQTKLDELSIEEPSKAKSNGGGISSILKTLMSKKYRCYTLVFIAVFIGLILLKPNSVKNINIDSKSGEIKVGGINIIKFVKTWIIFSVIISIAVYVYYTFLCNKNGSGCKLCGK
jgi:hypothetical protein